MIVYQIMVDRFSKVDQKQNVKSWDLPVEGGIHEFYGGNLKGITSRIDHIVSLDVDAIYLTPIFESSTYHRYDTLNYFKIDPMVGTDEEFRELVDKFHSKGIKVFLDGVFNHANSKSEVARQMGSGKFWRGFHDLAELRLEDSQTMKFIFSVIEHWMNFGIDGFRIDCANDIGMVHLDEIRNKIHEFGGEMIGEIMTYAKDWMDHLDGVMNYFFREGTLSLLKGELPIDDYVLAMNEMVEKYPLEKLLNSWTMISSHDTPRLSNVLDEERKVRLAIATQYIFAGHPMVYYGEEVGMNGGQDPFNRSPMAWNRENDRILFYKRMGKIRKDLEVLTNGKIKVWRAGNLVSILRYDEWEKFVIFLMNPTYSMIETKVMLPYSYAFDGLEMEDLNGGKKMKIFSGSINIKLDPFDFALLTPKDDIESYTFFKKR
jgi:glycosidase